MAFPPPLPDETPSCVLGLGISSRGTTADTLGSGDLKEDKAQWQGRGNPKPHTPNPKHTTYTWRLKSDVKGP